MPSHWAFECSGATVENTRAANHALIPHLCRTRARFMLSSINLKPSRACVWSCLSHPLAVRKLRVRRQGCTNQPQMSEAEYAQSISYHMLAGARTVALRILARRAFAGTSARTYLDHLGAVTRIASPCSSSRSPPWTGSSTGSCWEGPPSPERPRARGARRTPLASPPARQPVNPPARQLASPPAIQSASLTICLCLPACLAACRPACSPACMPAWPLIYVYICIYNRHLGLINPS